VVALAPERRLALEPRIEEAAIAAGDRWRALGDPTRAERAYRRAAAFDYGGRRLRPRSERDRRKGAADPRGHTAASSPAESSDAAAPVPAASAPVTALEPAVEDWLLGGTTLARGLLPLVESFPQLLAPGPRSRAWAEWLTAEDPTAPDSLEVAARIDAAAGRLGGAERKLVDLVYYSPDRAAGHARAAEIWQRVGQGRRACAAWERAARLGPPDDPRWCEVLACVRRDPGAGDAEAIARYLGARGAAPSCVTRAPSAGAGADPPPDAGASDAPASDAPVTP
jgi:tetratricopeptide (TPR) repeat protein